MKKQEKKISLEKIIEILSKNLKDFGTSVNENNIVIFSNELDYELEINHDNYYGFVSHIRNIKNNLFEINEPLSNEIDEYLCELNSIYLSENKKLKNHLDLIEYILIEKIKNNFNEEQFKLKKNFNRINIQIEKYIILFHCHLNSMVWTLDINSMNKKEPISDEFTNKIVTILKEINEIKFLPDKE